MTEPLHPAHRDRANARLASMAARGFVDTPDAAIEATRLPDGLFTQGGVVMFYCRVCYAPTPWEGEIEEYEDGLAENVCGGSPRCCP